METARKTEEYREGYNPITSRNGAHSDMMLDFGIIFLNRDTEYSDALSQERAYLLIEGDVEFTWNGITYRAVRNSCFDENPVTLHVPKDVKVEIRGMRDNCEICMESTVNDTIFESRLYSQEDVKSEIFGKGVMDETSLRTVRTVFDGESAPYSNMVIGEVINHPGRWSSYPPHHHPQPEIYHYRFLPKQGFGISVLNDNAYVMHDGDSTFVTPGHTHAQVAAPGYAMYYIWMIAHLENDKWLPSTRYYTDEHKWLTKSRPKIWHAREGKK